MAAAVTSSPKISPQAENGLLLASAVGEDATVVRLVHEHLREYEPERAAT
jgi:hypothetical protein